MERERPEYLPPIKPNRWSFPWLGFIGVVVLALAVFGIKQHLDTQAAWDVRFKKPKVASQLVTPPGVPVVDQNTDPLEHIQQIREARERAERELKERASWRCINGIPFRQIPGGWENVPGERC